MWTGCKTSIRNDTKNDSPCGASRVVSEIRHSPEKRLRAAEVKALQEAQRGTKATLAAVARVSTAQAPAGPAAGWMQGMSPQISSKAQSLATRAPNNGPLAEAIP